jgi:transporter family protein
MEEERSPMTNWYLPAITVSVLFGIHNLFVKRAAGRLPDAWGALVLEGTAAAVILLWIGATALIGNGSSLPRDAQGVALAATGGLFIGAGSILYFWVFRLGAPLSVVVPLVLTGWVFVAAILGVVSEGEIVTGRHAAGFACAAVAIWLLS